MSQIPRLWTPISVNGGKSIFHLPIHTWAFQRSIGRVRFQFGKSRSSRKAHSAIDLATASNNPEGKNALYRDLVPPEQARRSLEVLVLDRRGHATRAGSEVRLYVPGMSPTAGPDWLAVNSVIHFYLRIRINKWERFYRSELHLNRKKSE